MLNRVEEDPSALGTVSISAPFMTGYSVVTLYDALEGVTYNPLERMLFLIPFPRLSGGRRKVPWRNGPSRSIAFDFKAMSRHLNGDSWKLQGYADLRPDEHRGCLPAHEWFSSPPAG
jgi:hypothetical protein